MILVLAIIGLIGLFILSRVMHEAYRDIFSEVPQYYDGAWPVLGTCSVCAAVILGVSCAIAPLCSFGTAADLDATYNGVIAEYGHAIERYTDSAVLINVGEGTFTDFRYSGYQESVVGLIKDLLDKTSEYNHKLLMKRAYNANPVFSWLIILPPDSLKLISLVDY